LAPAVSVSTTLAGRPGFFLTGTSAEAATGLAARGLDSAIFLIGTRGAFFGGGADFAGLADLTVAFAITFGSLIDVVAFLVLTTGVALVGFFATAAAFGAGLLAGLRAGLTADLTTCLAIVLAAGFFDVFEGIVGLRMTKIYPQGKSAQDIGPGAKKAQQNQTLFAIGRSQAKSYKLFGRTFGVQSLRCCGQLFLKSGFRGAEGRCRRCCCRACGSEKRIIPYCLFFRRVNSVSFG